MVEPGRVQAEAVGLWILNCRTTAVSLVFLGNGVLANFDPLGTVQSGVIAENPTFGEDIKCVCD